MTPPRDRTSTRTRRGVLAPVLVGLAGCGLLGPGGGHLEVDHWRDLHCTAIAVPPGPEDIAIDHATGKAYVASTDRWAVAGQRPARGPIGHLSMLDLEQARPRAIDVTPARFARQVFQPQGIGLWPGPDKRLFVVNRRPAFDAKTGRWDDCRLSNAIEVLAVENHGLRPLETIESQALIRPNDVAAASPKAFYVTNDHGARTCWGRNLRDLFGLNRGHVLYHDGKAFRTAAEDVPFANGIAYDGTHDALYVASSLDGAIERFRAQADGALDGQGPIALGTAPDNLSLDPHGRLLLAAHPDRWRFLLYARGWLGAERAPSQIVAIAAPDANEPEAAEVWRDDGGTISAASAAAVYHWREEDTLRLLIGGVFTDHVLLCDRPAGGKKDGPGEPGPQSGFGEAGNVEIEPISADAGAGQGSTPRR